MILRQLISFFLAMLMALTSANAYVSQRLGGKNTLGQESVLQAENVILLNENGTPRCFVGERPGEYLMAEQLDVDTLRECDEDDELYARIIFGAEEISLGVAPAPTAALGKALAISTALGFGTSCGIISLAYWLFPNTHVSNGIVEFGFTVVFLAGGISGGLLLPAMITGKMAAGYEAGGVLASIVGGGLGLAICGKLQAGN